MYGPEGNWPSYNPQEIEPRWRKLWEETGLYLTLETSDKPKFYCLDFFPYPSGDGLHVGHCRNYVPTDVLSRFKRLQGFNVLHPMGWDAFGEPAEQYAVAHGVHPRVTTDRNTANFRRQMNLIGASYDWSREIDSSQPEYYRWTQWFFLKLYQRGLAYRDTNWQWWCPECQTTLSSHESVGGVCWRGHRGVIRREIPAWYFRITAYADRLLEGLERIDWPEKVKTMQRNWIGRSEGVEIEFPLADHSDGMMKLTVFTTRPDTLFGVTFMALAPEHPLVQKLTTAEQRAEVSAYVGQALSQSEIERANDTRTKTGVFTGSEVVNPLNGERVPVWVADYVLASYGSGAIMGVPAHDARDFEFARVHNLPVRMVIAPPGYGGAPLEEAYTGPGTMIHSGQFDGCSNEQDLKLIADELERQKIGKYSVQFWMRDWLISRQRYWGTPIPIIHCPACGEVPVPEEDLPVLLPEMRDFQPDGSGRSPLARLPEFVHTTCPRCSGPAERETDTMGGFACSSWYFLRFTSPHYHQGPFEPAAMRYWMPVDLYVGGTEHAVLHLLYSRFWTEVMYDVGIVPFDEPFSRLLNQGQLMGPDGFRMSKSRGNVITPDSVVDEYGADALRLYALFIAPFEQDVAWSIDGINGARRFLNRLWTVYGETYAACSGATVADIDLERLLHRTIRGVTERMDGMRFNTMVSMLMEFVNELMDRQRAGKWLTRSFHQALETLMVLIAPAAPYIAEELWSLTGHAGSVHRQPWPNWDADLAQIQTAQIAVQVDGKVRAMLEIGRDASQEDVEQAAYAMEKICAHLANRVVDKVYYVPGRILNIVTHA